MKEGFVKIGQPINKEWHKLAGRENRQPFQFAGTETALDYQPKIESLPTQIKSKVVEVFKRGK